VRAKNTYHRGLPCGYLCEEVQIPATKNKGSVLLSVHTHQMMHFNLAANKLLGYSFSKEVAVELVTGHQAQNLRDAKEASSRYQLKPVEW
jgi:hypothetical protein